MIACIAIPGFELRAALRKQPGLALRPAALSPVPGTEPLIGPVTAAADALGVRPGMRLGEALATCPSLVLVEQDPAAAEEAWEGILRRLEDTGFAVDPAGVGTVYFETRGVERLYGGLEPALKRASAGRAPRAGGQKGRRACRAPGCRRGRTSGAGRPARLGPGERREGRARARPPPAVGDRGGARVPGGDRERADLAACVRRAARDAAGSAGAGGALRAAARAVPPAGRRRLMAADGDAARPDGGAGAPEGGARVEAGGA